LLVIFRNIRFVLLDSGWSILNEFGSLQHVSVKKWYAFANTTAEEKKVKSFTCFGGVFAKNTNLETKFPSPFGSGNFSSLDWYFLQIPLSNMIYLFNSSWWNTENTLFFEQMEWKQKSLLYYFYLNYIDQSDNSS
jgi:hypothetical protein